MSESLNTNPEPKREYDPRHVARDGLRIVEKDGQAVEIHDTNNLKELYEAYWRQDYERHGYEDMPSTYNPVQDAYLESLTNTGDGLRMLRVLRNLRDNQEHTELFEKLDEIALLRHRIQEAKAHGRQIDYDKTEGDLWDYYHSKYYDILIPEIQRLDKSLDPHLFCR